MFTKAFYQRGAHFFQVSLKLYYLKWQGNFVCNKSIKINQMWKNYVFGYTKKKMSCGKLHKISLPDFRHDTENPCWTPFHHLTGNKATLNMQMKCNTSRKPSTQCNRSLQRVTHIHINNSKDCQEPSAIRWENDKCVVLNIIVSSYIKCWILDLLYTMC